jgi:acetyl-CoA synthetase
MTKLIKTSNFDKVLKGTKLNKEKYEKLYKESIENNDEFWDKVAKRIDWKKSYEKVKEVNYNDNISIKWFLKV